MTQVRIKSSAFKKLVIALKAQGKSIGSLRGAGAILKLKSKETSERLIFNEPSLRDVKYFIDSIYEMQEEDCTIGVIIFPDGTVFLFQEGEWTVH